MIFGGKGKDYFLLFICKKAWNICKIRNLLVFLQKLIKQN